MFGTNSNGVVGPAYVDGVQSSSFLNDNYFMAGLDALLSNPMHNLRNIMTPVYNASIGIFGAKVFIRGIPTLITVDDFFAFKA